MKIGSALRRVAGVLIVVNMIAVSVAAAADGRVIRRPSRNAPSLRAPAHGSVGHFDGRGLDVLKDFAYRYDHNRHDGYRHDGYHRYYDSDRDFAHAYRDVGIAN